MGTLSTKNTRAGQRLVTVGHLFSPREQGAIAYIEGESMDGNPYSPLNVDHDEWRDGYSCEAAFVSDNFDACFGEAIGSA